MALKSSEVPSSVMNTTTNTDPTIDSVRPVTVTPSLRTNTLPNLKRAPNQTSAPLLQRQITPPQPLPFLRQTTQTTLPQKPRFQWSRSGSGSQASPQSVQQTQPSQQTQIHSPIQCREPWDADRRYWNKMQAHRRQAQKADEEVLVRQAEVDRMEAELREKRNALSNIIEKSKKAWGAVNLALLKAFPREVFY